MAEFQIFDGRIRYDSERVKYGQNPKIPESISPAWRPHDFAQNLQQAPGLGQNHEWCRQAKYQNPESRIINS